MWGWGTAWDEAIALILQFARRKLAFWRLLLPKVIYDPIPFSKYYTPCPQSCHNSIFAVNARFLLEMCLGGSWLFPKIWVGGGAAMCHVPLDVDVVYEFGHQDARRSLRSLPMSRLVSDMGGLVSWKLHCNPAVPCDAQPGSLEGNWNNAFFGLWDGTVDDFAVEQANNVRCLPF